MGVETARRARARFVRAQLLDAAAALGPAALLPAVAASGAAPGSADAAAAAAARRAAEAAIEELIQLGDAAGGAAGSGGGAAAAPADAGASLEGRWQLVYVSSGTVVTRALALPAMFPWRSFEVMDVAQTLTPLPEGAGQRGQAGPLATDNEACVRLGPLGTWRVRARGTWAPEDAPAAGGAEPHASARVSFAELSVEPMALPLLGALPRGAAAPPALRLPLPAPLAARSARFRTLYLDRRCRVAEGADSGRRFVFARVKPAAS